jgi:HEPN domain-containing protein
MKKRPDSLSPPDWFKIARKDWTRIHYMLEKEDAEAAAVFLQQSLEKYLKAFLLQGGWKLRKIHELDALLDDAAKYSPDLENFRDLCERVSGYYFVDRYPLLYDSELSCEDIKKDLEEAKRFIQTMFPEEKLK